MSVTIDDFKKKVGEWLEKGRELFSKEQKEQKFAQAKLQDGTVITYEGETPLPNMPVFVMDEKGNQTPLIDGTHVMEDGSMLIVKGGVIAEVQGKPEDPNATQNPNPNPGENMADDKPIAGGQAKTVIESIVKESRFEIEKEFGEKLEAVKAEFKKEIETQKAEASKLTEEKKAMEEKFSKQEKAIGDLVAMLEEFAKQPATESAKKKEKKDEDEKTLEQKAEEFRKKYVLNQF